MLDKKKIKIRELFAVLTSERKNNVRTKLSKKFKISVDSVKINWIYAGKIPDQNIDDVLKVINSELKMQSDELIQLMDVL